MASGERSLVQPGEKVIIWDDRQHRRDPVLQVVWEGFLWESLAAHGVKDWTVRKGHLDAGDWALLVGHDPTIEEQSSFEVVAIGEEKDTVDDFISSEKDGRFFGTSNEIERISQAGTEQFVLAYPAWLPWDHYGILHSLWLDYAPLFYQITSLDLYAKFVTKFAARYGQPRSKKGGNLEKKKIDFEQRQVNCVAYYFTEEIAKKLLTKLKTPQVIFKTLEKCEFSPKAGLIICPEEFRDCGIKERGSKRLQIAYDLHMTQSEVKEKKVLDKK